MQPESEPSPPIHKSFGGFGGGGFGGGGFGGGGFGLRCATGAGMMPPPQQEEDAWGKQMRELKPPSPFGQRSQLRPPSPFGGGGGRNPLQPPSPFSGSTRPKKRGGFGARLQEQLSDVAVPMGDRGKMAFFSTTNEVRGPPALTVGSLMIFADSSKAKAKARAKAQAKAKGRFNLLCIATGAERLNKRCRHEMPKARCPHCRKQRRRGSPSPRAAVHLGFRLSPRAAGPRAPSGPGDCRGPSLVLAVPTMSMEVVPPPAPRSSRKNGRRSSFRD